MRGVVALVLDTGLPAGYWTGDPRDDDDPRILDTAFAIREQQNEDAKRAARKR